MCYVLLAACVTLAAITAAANPPISIKNHPYLLELRNNNKHICTAILIDPKIALTAAQCTFNIPWKNLTIQAGSSIAGNRYVHQYKVGHVYSHKRFNLTHPINDIALIFPKNLIKTDGKFVAPIGLTKMQYLPGTEVEVAGWKLVKNQPILTSEKLLLKGSKTCKVAYRRVNITVSPNEICAYERKKTVCKGGPGGALVIRGKLVGIVSKIYSPLCTRYPGIYTSVYHFKRFMKKVVKKVLGNKRKMARKLNKFKK